MKNPIPPTALARLLFLFVLALLLAATAAAQAQTTHDVTVGDNFFSPSFLEITVGDTVRWTNAAGGNFHDVTANDGSFASATATSFVFEMTFNTVEDVDYFCTVHPSTMRATISVMEGAGPPPEPAAQLTLNSVNAPPGSFEQGESISISSETENIGDAMSDPYTITFYASDNNIISDRDTPIGSEMRDGLAPGASHTGPFSATIPLDLAPGLYFIGAIIDLDDGNESNNVNQDNAAITVIEGQGESFPLAPGHNGNWWGGLERNGEGGQLEVADDGSGGLIFVATIYSYNTAGDQIFVVAVGPVDGDTASVDVFITEGGLWGDAFDPELVIETAWGTGSFTSISCDLIQMVLTPNAEFQSLGYTVLAYNLIRLTTPIVPCAEPAN